MIMAHHMTSDMASNVGITFRSPEEFFLGEEPRPFARTFDPSSYTIVPAPTNTSTLTHQLEIDEPKLTNIAQVPISLRKTMSTWFYFAEAQAPESQHSFGTT